MSIRLTTLGAVRLFRGDTELPDLPAQRLRFALLVYLAVERDVSREAVLSMFWPERDDARGRHALRQMLYELRQVLGEDWIEIRRDRIVAHVDVDASAFEAAVSEDRADDALAMYGGAFLLGFSLDSGSFESWADRRRAQLGRSYRRLQRDRIAALVEAGDVEGSLASARRWVELDPLEDEAVHTLIERLAAAGQRAAALQYYATYEQQLADELDVEPLEQTRELIAAIRSGDAVPQHIERLAPAAAGSAANDPPVPATVTESRNRLRPHRLRLAAVVLVAAIAIALGVFIARPGVYPSSAAARPVRIAIQPLADLTVDKPLGALSNLLTETLAHSLARSQFFEVIPPNGVELLRSEGAAEDSVGRELGVDYLVGGSVSTDGDRVRVSLELLDGRNGTVVHSEVVERPFAESRNLVEDVVEQSATILRGEIGSHVRVTRVQALTTSEQAWRFLLEGRHVQEAAVSLLLQREYRAAEREHIRADSLLARAAELDTRWAEPIVQRARVLERRAYSVRFSTPYDSVGYRSLLEAALDMAALAAERDSLYADGWALRGAVLQHLAQIHTDPGRIDRLLQESERALRRAIHLDPLHQSAWRGLADLLFASGRYGEAYVAARRAYQIDPYDAHVVRGILNRLFATALELGEDDQAQGWCHEGRRRFVEDLPFLYCLLALHAWGDGVDADPAALRRAIQNFRIRSRIQPELNDRFDMMIAAAHVRAGQPDSARAILGRTTTVRSDPGLLWIRASVHLALGEDSAAVALLRAYVETGMLEAPRVARSRPFWRLHTDPDLAGTFMARR